MADPDTPQTDDAIEADAMGEKPDLGRTPDGMRDALDRALSGTDSGSDTRAGSLQGGASSGSDVDPDSDTINEALASEGQASAARNANRKADPDPVNNTGDDPSTKGEADAATG
ncbi:ribonuclease [Brevundimonas sp.]